MAELHHATSIVNVISAINQPLLSSVKLSVMCPYAKGTF